MCGLIGVTVNNPDSVSDSLLAIFKNQELRGGMGGGIALLAGSTLFRKRSQNPEKLLNGFLAGNKLQKGNLLMFHHRYPTSTINLPRHNHPIKSEDSGIYMVHNGCISGYGKLAEDLIKGGHTFETITDDKNDVTDSEVIIHVLEDEIAKRQGMKAAFEALAQKVNGTMAIALFIRPYRMIYLFKIYNPLRVFESAGNYFFASEMPSTGFNEVISLESGELGMMDLYGYHKIGIVKLPKPEVIKWENTLSGCSWMTGKHCKICGMELIRGEKRYCAWCDEKMGEHGDGMGH